MSRETRAEIRAVLIRCQALGKKLILNNSFDALRLGIEYQMFDVRWPASRFEMLEFRSVFLGIMYLTISLFRGVLLVISTRLAHQDQGPWDLRARTTKDNQW